MIQHQNLPVPKYRIGDKVWAKQVESGQEFGECPDCLGSGKWAAKTPAGKKLDLRCLKCSGGGKVSWNVYRAGARCLTVGSIRATTETTGYDAGVRYMCVETGIGTGTIYPEANLFGCEGDAVAASTPDAEERTRKLRDNDERRFGVRDPYAHEFFDLGLEEERKRRYDAEESVATLLDKIEGALVVSHTDAQLRVEIQSIVDERSEI